MMMMKAMRSKAKQGKEQAMRGSCEGKACGPVKHQKGHWTIWLQAGQGKARQ